MSYDFTTRINRQSQNSSKWKGMRKHNPEVPEGIVPLSVADMELMNPPEITEGLKQFLDHRILGYTDAGEDYYTETVNWMQRRHHWTIEKDWLVLLPGVVTAINVAVRAFVKPGEKIAILTPVYYPFKKTIEACGCTTVTSSLINQEGVYSINFDDLEAKLADPEVKMLIFCSPHNPIGRVWSAEETERVCRICMENNVFLIADEIHSDLIMPGVLHTSAGVFKEYLSNCAICTAPSKTFNLAGFQASNIIIPNEEYRRKMPGSGGYFSLNFLSYKACEIVYNQCEDWLDELLEVIDGNRKTVEEFMKEHLPGVKVYRMQGTYLQWLDFSCLGLDTKELEAFMTRKAHLFLDEGYLFGEAGAGYERWNLACPRETLQEGLNRLAAAVRAEGF